jgi:hypothetical protein
MGRRFVSLLMIAFAVSAAIAQAPADRAATDAIVVDRVVEASKRDLPTALLKRIVEEDIELLRGRRQDGTYEHAEWERFEASRVNASVSVQPRDTMQTIELSGENVYRVILDIPGRRLLFRKNNPVWIERMDVEYVTGPSQSRTQSIEVKAWMQPGDLRPFDLETIARQAKVKVIAVADKEAGYGNLDIALVQARLVDLPGSPYAAIVSHAKSLLAALDDGGLDRVRTEARRMRDAALAKADADPAPLRKDTAAMLELQTELQIVEGLLTGSETQRREGLDRLRRIIHNLRP